MLGYLLDENEFLGPYGIRSLSRYHLDHPFSFLGGRPGIQSAVSAGGIEHRNVRRELELAGPSLDARQRLIVRALLNLYAFFGDDFKVECPTGSGRYMTLFEVAQRSSGGWRGTSSATPNGHRPVYGGTKKFQEDPHWRDLILFYEYFHGDNGAGLGASHQTGWTGLVAFLMDLFGRIDAKRFLETDRETNAVPPR